jgi:hypothetical protein
MGTPFGCNHCSYARCAGQTKLATSQDAAGASECAYDEIYV